MATNIANAGVQVIAAPRQFAVVAPNRTPLMDLAEGLQNLNPEIKQGLSAFAKKREAEDAARAKADALANSGEAFANAVRSGRIEATQSPWYMAQYEETAAQVRAQSEVSQIVADSASWEERNDPAKFNERLNRTVGEVAQGYAGVHQSQGFNAAAGPLLQQSIAQNVSYNVSRIKQEHDQNISTLATTSILNAVKANGGAAPTASSVYAALEPAHEEWLRTGGTEPQWNNLQINSIIAAAANSGDEEVANKLLDALSDDRGGKGALANQAGPTGSPVAEDIQQARYRIGQAISNQGFASIRANQNKEKMEGMKAIQEFWSSPLAGAFIADRTSKPAIVAMLKEKGYSDRTIQYALSDLAEDASKNASLTTNLTNDAEGYDLFVRANKEGLSASLEDSITDRVRQGTMTYAQGKSLIATATTRTSHLESEARSDVRAAKSDARAAATASRSLNIEAARTLKDGREQTLGVISSTLQARGSKALLDGPTRLQFGRGMSDAEGAWLKSHPGDVMGAETARDNYANKWLLSKMPKSTTKATTGTIPKANPRGK